MLVCVCVCVCVCACTCTCICVEEPSGFTVMIEMTVSSCLPFQLSRSVVSNSLQPHGMRHTRLPCPSLSPGSLLKLMSIESMMPSNHLILCCPLLLLPSIFPSIRVFSNESTLHIR